MRQKDRPGLRERTGVPACCKDIKTVKSGPTKIRPFRPPRSLNSRSPNSRPLNSGIPELQALRRPTIERPQCQPGRSFNMTPIRLFTAVALLVATTSSAFAADPVFPPGARVGMTPLVGLAKAKSFVGFETEDQGVKVLVTDLPAEAYGEVANAFKANPAGAGGVKPESIETAAGLAYYTAENAKDGVTNVRRYSMILPGPTFSGYVAVQVPENAAKIYTDEAVRQMFASAVIRTA